LLTTHTHNDIGQLIILRLQNNRNNEINKLMHTTRS